MAERDSNILNEIARMESDIFQMKKAQLLGYDNVRTFDVQTVNTWDYDATFTPAFAGDSAQFKVTFTASQQPAPFANLKVKVLYGGVEGDYSVRGFGATDKTIIHSDVVGLTLAQVRVSNVVRWRVITTVSAAKNIKLKFYVEATDTGTITIA